jgi:hypothetical protein
MGLALAVLGVCAVVVALLAAAYAVRRRRVARAERRAAALAEVARRIDAAVSSLGELSVGDPDEGPVPVGGAAARLVDDGLPGRAGLLQALAESISSARTEGGRLAAAVVRSGEGDAGELARAARLVADGPVFAVGPRAVALVLPGAGRADALGVLARIETRCSSCGRAVELEPREDALELAARLLGPETPVDRADG